jgi:hypothetical protein
MAFVFRLIGLGRLCLCVALLMLVPAGAFAQPIQSPIPPDAKVVQIGSFPFPSKIAGLSRTLKTDYRSAALGFSVRYMGIDDTWADIYIYDREQNLASGSALAHAKAELASTLGDIDAGVSRGSYESAKVVDRSQDETFAKAHLKIAQAGKTRDSYVFIAVLHKNFVKIRLTSGDRKYADRIAQGFLEEYRQLLGKT